MLIFSFPDDPEYDLRNIHIEFTMEDSNHDHSGEEGQEGRQRTATRGTGKCCTLTTV